MGYTLYSSFREVELEYHYNGILWAAIVWYPNKTIGIGERLICGGGRLERFYCIYTTVNMAFASDTV